jgi:hypothetical protein
MHYKVNAGRCLVSQSFELQRQLHSKYIEENWKEVDYYERKIFED